MVRKATVDLQSVDSITYLHNFSCQVSKFFLDACRDDAHILYS
jgi:hypothetical protein